MRKRDTVSLVLANEGQTHSLRHNYLLGADTLRTLLHGFYTIVGGYPQQLQTLLNSLFRHL